MIYSGPFKLSLFLLLALGDADAFLVDVGHPEFLAASPSCLTRRWGLNPDGFGEWMLNAGDDYDVQAGPRRMPKMLRDNTREGWADDVPNQPPYRRRVPDQGQRHYPYYSAYGPEAYQNQVDFIDNAQGTNRMDNYQLEQGLPHQLFQGYTPPSQSRLQTHYSSEYQKQEDFINKAQGTNRMDNYQLEQGVPHQQLHAFTSGHTDPGPPTSMRPYQYYSEEYRRQREFIDRAQGTNGMEYQLEKGVPHQYKVMGRTTPSPPSGQPRASRYFSDDYNRQQEFIDKAQGTNRMEYQLERGLPHQDNM